MWPSNLIALLDFLGVGTLFTYLPAIILHAYTCIILFIITFS